MKMPELLNKEAAGDTDVVIQYDLSEPLYHVIKDGEMQAHEGEAEAPTLTIKMSDEDFVKLIKGELNGMTAFMMGKIKLQGDMMLAQKLAGFIDPAQLA